MKNLYQVTLERITYKGEKSIETRQLFAESPKKINTYRLGGFQHDTVKVVNAKKIRSRNTIELDVDIERNEVTPSISVDEHLDATLELNEVLTKKAKKSDDISEMMELLGYHELNSDNTYNYSSDFENELLFSVYSKNPKADRFYEDDLIVVVYEHTGLDVRAGYKFKGVYNTPDRDGLSNFYEMHVRISVLDQNGDEVAQYDGDWSFGQMLRDYKIKSYNEKTQELIVTKGDQDFTVVMWHPAMR